MKMSILTEITSLRCACCGNILEASWPAPTVTFLECLGCGRKSEGWDIVEAYAVFRSMHLKENLHAAPKRARGER